MRKKCESIAPGQRIFLLLQSANRDEREFERADDFDIYRRPVRHLDHEFLRDAHGPIPNRPNDPVWLRIGVR